MMVSAESILRAFGGAIVAGTGTLLHVLYEHAQRRARDGANGMTEGRGASSINGEFCLVLVYTRLLGAADTSRFSPPFPLGTTTAA